VASHIPLSGYPIVLLRTLIGSLLLIGLLGVALILGGALFAEGFRPKGASSGKHPGGAPDAEEETD
jgi:hypothetical protein